MTSRPRPFVLVASDHGPMIVNRLDFNTAPMGGTYGVGHQILSLGAYNPEEIALCSRILESHRERFGSGVVMLDCGANVGVHTISLATAMVGWGNVLAFEAQERIFYALCGNIILNNLSNAFARRVALSRECGTMKIPVPDYTRNASFGSLELRFSERTEHIGQSVSYSDHAMTEISTLSIDSMRLPRVDFIKLDVEGMELEVLEGARETIDRCRPTILVEFIKVGREALETVLSGFGYFWSVFGENLLASLRDVESAS